MSKTILIVVISKPIEQSATTPITKETTKPRIKITIRIAIMIERLATITVRGSKTDLDLGVIRVETTMVMVVVMAGRRKIIARINMVEETTNRMREGIMEAIRMEVVGTKDIDKSPQSLIGRVVLIVCFVSF